MLQFFAALAFLPGTLAAYEASEMTVQSMETVFFTLRTDSRSVYDGDYAEHVC